MGGAGGAVLGVGWRRLGIGHGDAALPMGAGASETPRSAEYAQVQSRLARGWNTWDVHSVATQVLLPEGLAIHVGMKHNTIAEWRCVAGGCADRAAG